MQNIGIMCKYLDTTISDVDQPSCLEGPNTGYQKGNYGVGKER